MSDVINLGGEVNISFCDLKEVDSIQENGKMQKIMITAAYRYWSPVNSFFFHKLFNVIYTPPLLSAAPIAF